jgi:hypothetical protein
MPEKLSVLNIHYSQVSSLLNVLLSAREIKHARDVHKNTPYATRVDLGVI